MARNIIWRSAGVFLGPLLFIIFLANLFSVVKDIDIARYADDKTPFIVENNIDVIASLEQTSDVLFNWLKNNRLKSNIVKCHVLASTNKPVSFSHSLLPVISKIGVNLNFNDHISDLCKKASRKVSALASHSFYGIKQKKIINECFFTSQFSYCPLI